MIFDSVFWKKELNKNYKGILKYNNVEMLNKKFDATYNNIEKNIFLSAFIIRKLVESKKLTDKIDKYERTVSGYSTMNQINRLNRFDIDENYDFKHIKPCNIKFKDLCNWLIHSYVCSLKFDDYGKAIGFYVASDYDKNKIIYEIPLEYWSEYIKTVIEDNINKVTYIYDENKQDYIVSEKK